LIPYEKKKMPEMEDVKPARKMKVGVENLDSHVERSEEPFFICMKHSHLTGMGMPCCSMEVA
jgi:hypothetical protein